MAVGISLKRHPLCRVDGQTYSNINPDDLGRVTYAQCPHRHYSVETGFDVNGVLAKRFPPRKLIRIHYMNVELRQLTYAYFQTYGTLQDMTYTGSALNLSTIRDNASARYWSRYKLPKRTALLSVRRMQAARNLHRELVELICLKVREFFEYRTPSISSLGHLSRQTPCS